jgi:DNA-binding transcriptional LysR family regulator
MRPTFDMDALRTIVVATELKSFARAAAQLGMTQSAVSMQLKRLENQARQPLFRRSGRGLVPTEAGDALLVYARRIIALHDEAAASLGTAATPASVRIGIPQDFFEDVVADAIQRFSRQRPGVHVEVRTGRNHALEEEVRANRLDVAIAWFPDGSNGSGLTLASLPMQWFGPEGWARGGAADPLSLVLFDHPCVFRQAALQSLEREGLWWRVALTTPSLPGVWSAVRHGHGVSVRTSHRVPQGVRGLGPESRLPRLPLVELRMLTATEISPAGSELRDILDGVVRTQMAQQTLDSAA